MSGGDRGGLAEEKSGEEQVDKSKVHSMGQVVVTAKEASTEMGAEVRLTPTMSTIDLDQYETIGEPQNIGDYLNQLIMFDYRGHQQPGAGLGQLQHARLGHQPLRHGHRRPGPAQDRRPQRQQQRGLRTLPPFMFRKSKCCPDPTGPCIRPRASAAWSI